jgi:dihydroorotase
VSAIVILGGRVVDPASGLDQTADVLISDGVVARIGRIGASRDAQTLDAEGCLVAPGLIDIHVHFREPDPDHQESIATGAAAAVAGGFTGVVCMPNTHPPTDTPQRVRALIDRGRRADLARVFVAGSASAERRGERLAPIPAMAAAGAVAFTDDGDCIWDPRLMERVLRAAADADRPVLQHCQDPILSRGGVMNAGAISTRLGLEGWPAAAEETVLERDIRLNRTIGCAYHAQHVSCAGSVEIVRRARSAGAPITAEVTPHHLLLTEDACRDYDPIAKVNPPLRTASDRAALKAAIADGTITILATDHAPHPGHRKHVDFAEAAFGVVGLDCALPLYIRALLDDGVVDSRGLLAMMTVNPARLLGLDRMGLGSIAVGGPADLTVIDPDLTWTIDPAAFASTGRNCPFAGWQVRGRAVATLVAGRLVQSHAPQRLRA